jgi:hypothetical protein
MLTEHAHALVDQLAKVLELIGVAVIIGSIILATLAFLRHGLWTRDWVSVYFRYRSDIGRGVLQGSVRVRQEIKEAQHVTGLKADTSRAKNTMVFVIAAPGRWPLLSCRRHFIWHTVKAMMPVEQRQSGIVFRQGR